MIEPAYLSIPPRVGSYGDEAIDLAKVAGMDLDEEQELAVDALLSYGPGGARAARESAILEGRQNGKSERVLLPVVMFDLWLGVPDRIMWTAHLFRTSRDAFKAFCKCIAVAPELSRRVKKISFSHGEESIELHPDPKTPGEPGALLEFMARESGGGRGIGGKRVVFDEALILSADAMDALVPALSARSDSQINYGSSGAKVTSTQLHKLIKRGRSGKDPSLIWVEFCAPGSWEDPGCALGSKCMHMAGVDGCKLDDETLWPYANHSLNKRGLTSENVRSERLILTPQGFGRERFGWHEIPVGVDGVISQALWLSRKDEGSTAVGRVGIGIDVRPDLGAAAVGMTGRRGDGRRHWQLLEHQPGTSWVKPYLRTLQTDGLEFGPVGVDPSSPAGALIPDLTADDEDGTPGFEVLEVVGRTLVQAWNTFHSSVLEDQGRHLNQDGFWQAIRECKTAPSGDSTKFSRAKSTGDICPLVAVTISDHAERAAPEPPQQFFGSWR